MNTRIFEHVNTIEKLLNDTPILKTIGATNKIIQSIQMDSRKVQEHTLFAAIKGTQVDGHEYIKSAIAKGAVAIICETIPEDVEDNITYIQVTNSSKALGHIANIFFDRPSEKLNLVGITGTNGKTTCVTLLHRLFMRLGYKVGKLSTVENTIGERVIEATHTTPDAITLHRLLSQMVNEGCSYAFMEVSSHAIHQERIAGVNFQGGAFTNITHDHLNYHGTFKNYINVKKSFFDNLPKNAFALSNVDDKRGTVMLQNTKAHKYTFSLKKLSDFKAKILDNSIIGLHLEIDGKEFFSRLIGEFNAYNLLQVYAIAKLLDMDEMETLTALSELKTAEGRFDYLQNTDKRITGIVDYAHTPDALEKVLQTIDQIQSGNGKVITVVGCGGDRDKTKRPRMAKIACDYSDQVILTSDNPRTENPDSIIQEMETGIPPYATQKTLSITNRLQAIKTACRLAQANDIILVAGKGHEKYQEINGVKNPFDDKEILRRELMTN